MPKWQSLGLLALLVPALAAAPQEVKPAAPNKVKPGEGKVSVHLSFSVAEYDPSKPSRAVLKCGVKNNSDLPVYVPVGYDGGKIRVQSGLLTLGKNQGAKEHLKVRRVWPGMQQVVFELPLDDILLGAGRPGAAWRWDWPRRPEPPHSPIHKYRKPGFVDQASFTVRLDLVGGSSLTSENATLKVKSGEAKQGGGR
jgi:hypothetical protein